MRLAGASYTFGPGPAPQAIRMLIWANVGAFVVSSFFPVLTIYFGLTPAAVFGELWLWQPVTYMFLHGGLFHILFNMLALWMFGTDLERRWGTPFFLRYYFITGVGAALTTLVLSLMPFAIADRIYYAVTIGASGSVYGILLAYALYFPNRPIFLYFLFPIPAKYFVMIIGAIAFYMSISDARGGIAHAAHLGGLVIGYLYLRYGNVSPMAELRYRWVKWKMDRMRRRFDIHRGGRGGRDRIH